MPGPPRPGGLTFVDEDGTEVVLDHGEAAALMALTGDLEGAIVSACPDCRACVVAAVALVDVLSASGAHARAGDLTVLADEAPTLHLYVVDDASTCRHLRWRDPLYDEWSDVVELRGPHALR